MPAPGIPGDYACLDAYTTRLRAPEREVVGREGLIATILASFERPELCNVALLGPAGSGKTAVVRAAMQADPKGRAYLEVDLARMIADISDLEKLAARLKELFDEVIAYNRANERGIVLFIDEFHQVVQLSAAAVEALKPLLADSGTRGVRVVVATTYEEFRDYVQPNQALVERLQRISVEPPGRDVTLAILKGMAERYGVSRAVSSEAIFGTIYDLTERHVPANAQPRKSITVLDAMIGWHRATGDAIDERLLARVLKESYGVDVAFSVDATHIKESLDRRVFAQDYATAMVEASLQRAVADLNDHTRPMWNALLCGSTGVGKALPDDALVPAVRDGRAQWLRNGDLVAGDMVFSASGRPTRVLATFPQGAHEVWELELSDGRRERCDGGHLWQVFDNAGGGEAKGRLATTAELADGGPLVEAAPLGGELCRLMLALPEPYDCADAELPADPYLLGAQLTCTAVTAISDERGAPYASDGRLARLAGGRWRRGGGPGSFLGRLVAADDASRAAQRAVELWAERVAAGPVACQALPSRAQRERALRGAIDRGGLVTPGKGAYLVRVIAAEGKAGALRRLLWSLGCACEEAGSSAYVEALAPSELMGRLYPDAGDLDRLLAPRGMVREAPWDLGRLKWDGVRSVRPTGETQEMTCIYVEDDDHLFQTSSYLATHNTQLCKELSVLLFGTERSLVRLDMTEYSQASSVERFRDVLSAAVWERPNSVVLLDEVDKASADVLQLLYQVLDDARLIDRNGREVSFANSYVIMTSNVASDLFERIGDYESSDVGSAEFVRDGMALLRRAIMDEKGRRFPPALLGRVESIIPFQPLSEETRMRVAGAKLAELAGATLSRHGVTLTFSRRILDFLVKEGTDDSSDAGGARAVVQRVSDLVTSAVAREINVMRDGGACAGRSLFVDVEGEMACENKYLAKGDARVVVRAAGAAAPSRRTTVARRVVA